MFEVIDAQAHIWERNHPGRPWIDGVEIGLDRNEQWPDTPSRKNELTGKDMLEAMALAGVDRVVLVNSSTHYGNDCSYACATAETYPDKFAVIGSLDPEVPDIEQQVARWGERPNAVGLRIVAKEQSKLSSGAYHEFLRAAQKSDVPICINAPGNWVLLESLARRYADVRFVIDHLGLPVVLRGDLKEYLRGLFCLVPFDNVVIKVSALPAYSKVLYPFTDAQSVLADVIDGFGLSRLIWGSDWTRINGVSYRESLGFIQESGLLTTTEKEMLLGQNLRRIFRWPMDPS